MIFQLVATTRDYANWPNLCDYFHDVGAGFQEIAGSVVDIRLAREVAVSCVNAYDVCLQLKLHIDPPSAKGAHRVTLCKHLGKPIAFRYACGDKDATKEIRAAGGSVWRKPFDLVGLEEEARDSMHGVFNADGFAVTVLTDVALHPGGDISKMMEVVSSVLDVAYDLLTLRWVAKEGRLSVNAACGFEMPSIELFPMDWKNRFVVPVTETYNLHVWCIQNEEYGLVLKHEWNNP